MKIWILFSFIVLLIWVTPGLAHPIRHIDLEYNSEEKVLMISIEHISRNRRDEYIRKILIFKNGEKVEEKYYNLQKNPSTFQEDINLEAEVGDILKIKAYVANGGSKSESITVKAASKKEEVSK